MVSTRLALGLAACALCLGACRGELRLPFWDPPPGRKIIGDVEFHGNEALSDGDIEDRLRSHSDNWVFGEKPLLDLADVAADATRIESLYAAEGYFGARVTGYRVEPIDGQAVRVHFNLLEGPPTRIRHVTLVGLDDHQRWGDAEREGVLRRLAPRLLGALPLQPGHRWTEAHHEAAKREIVRRLRDAGFYYVQLFGEARVARDADRADVVYRVWPGPLARVSEVLVRGNAQLESERILRRSEVVVGQVPIRRVLEQSRRQIYDLGVFYSVTVKVEVPPIQDLLGERPLTWDSLRDLDPDRSLPVVVGVNEKPRSEVRAGGGLSAGNDHSDLFARLGYQNKNLFGGLQFLDLSTRPAWVFLPVFWDIEEHGFGIDNKVVFRQPAFLEEYLQLSLTAEYEYGVHYGYRSHTLTGGLALSRRFLQSLHVEVGYRAQYDLFVEVADVLKLPSANRYGLAFSSETRLAYFEQVVILDLRDNPIDATEGIFAQIRAQEAQRWLGSQYEYLRLLAGLRIYVTPWEHLTLAFRVKYGQSFPLGTGSIPLPARIFGGGSADMRGYGAGAMGVNLCQIETCGASQDVRTGGNIKLLASFETRWSFGLEAPWDFGAVAFVDVGQVWSTYHDVTFESMHVAVGPGLRWASPVGPVRIDAGFLVKPAVLRFPELHVSIGQAF